MPDVTKVPRRRRVLGLDHEQRQQERRRLVLAAALELFGTQGYARSSIEQLCQTAGVGTNSFYELFSSKEDVLITLYDDLTTDLLDAVAAAYLEHREGDPIRPLVATFIHGAVDDPRVAQVEFIEAAGVSSVMEAHRRETRNRFVAGLVAIGADLREAATGTVPSQAGSSDGPSPRRNAIAVVGAIVEMTVDWLHDPDPDPLETLIDDVAHHCRRVMNAIIDDSRASSTT